MSARIKIIFFIVVVIVVAGLFGMSACVVRPDEAVQATQVALERARSVEAERFAPELLGAAEQDFGAAKLELGEQDQRWIFLRSYKHAQALLGSAMEAADKAYARGSEMVRLRQEAKASLDLAKLDVKSASESLKWFGDKLSRADLQSLQTTLEDLQQRLQQAQERFEEENFEEARLLGKSILSQASEIAGKLRNAT